MDANLDNSFTSFSVFPLIPLCHIIEVLSHPTGISGTNGSQTNCLLSTMCGCLHGGLCIVYMAEFKFKFIYKYIIYNVLIVCGIYNFVFLKILFFTCNVVLRIL